MILTVVPNPSLDKTTVVAGFQLGQTFRVPRPLGLAGGKGFNVARALRALGEVPLVVGPVGGHTGRAILDLAASEGLACAPVWIAGETRTCLTIVDPSTSRITEIYEHGPALGEDDWRAVITQATMQLQTATHMVLSGSYPPGTPPTSLRELVAEAGAARIPALLDTYGPHLAAALESEPTLVKINQHEAASMVGYRIEDATTAAGAALALQGRGAQAVVITLGRQGAVGVDATGRAFGWSAPELPGLYPIGSGDALFGGVIAGLARGESLREAVRLGVAVGAANTLQIGAGIFDPAQVEALLGEVRPLSGLGAAGHDAAATAG